MNIGDLGHLSPSSDSTTVGIY